MPGADTSPVGISDYLSLGGGICWLLWGCRSLWSEPPWRPSGPPATLSRMPPLHRLSASSDAHRRPARRGSCCTCLRLSLWNLQQTSRNESNMSIHTANEDSVIMKIEGVFHMTLPLFVYTVTPSPWWHVLLHLSSSAVGLNWSLTCSEHRNTTGL